MDHGFADGPPIYAADNSLRRQSVPIMREAPPFALATNDAAWATIMGRQDPNLLARRSMPDTRDATLWMPRMPAGAPSLMNSTRWGTGDGMVMGGVMMSMDDSGKLPEQIDHNPSMSQVRRGGIPSTCVTTTTHHGCFRTAYWISE